MGTTILTINKESYCEPRVLPLKSAIGMFTKKGKNLMLRDGKLVIDVGILLSPFKMLFFGLARATVWAFAFTVVGALIMRVLGGFGYARRALRYGADGEKYTYSSLTIRESPRWAARLLGWKKTKVVFYYSDQYNYWFHSTGRSAKDSKQLQRMYDMFIIRRELKKDDGFTFIVGKGEQINKPIPPPMRNPQVYAQVYAQNPNCSLGYQKVH